MCTVLYLLRNKYLSLHHQSRAFITATIIIDKLRIPIELSSWSLTVHMLHIQLEQELCKTEL